MDLMLISSPVNARSVHMPYFYLYLAGYLEKQGFSVAIVDPHFVSQSDNIEFILKQVREHNPRFIGFSSFCTDYNVVHALAVEVRKISTATILAGNAQPSIAPEDFLYEGSPFDIVVRGEGEITVKELLSSPCDHDSLMEINGIAFFEGSKVVETKKRNLMDLKDLGMPAYHLMDMDWYTRPTKNIIRRLAAVSAVIYTGRGCPFDCNFCASNVVWNTNDRPSAGGSAVRSRPLGDVIAELTILQNQYGFDFFYILDDTFGLKESAIKEFCAAYKKSGLKMLWAAETRANCVKNIEILEVLKDAGCLQLDFGVESGSSKILGVINKKIKLQHIHTAFDLCEKAGMRTFANLLLNMPEETEEDIDLSRQLLDRIHPTYTSIGLTMPYPGTPIYKSRNFKIDRNEYHLLDREFPVEKFRLCAHDLNLPKLLYQWQRRYKTFPLFEKSMIQADARYWKMLILSKHKWSYLIYLLNQFCRQPLSFLKVRWVRRHLMGSLRTAQDI